jgi:hypothetical protein
MRPSNLLLSLFLLVTLAFGGCDPQPTTKVSFAGRIFRVPNTHLITAGVFFLPASQYDRLLFIVDPESPLERQMSASIVGRAEEWCKDSFTPVVNLAKVPCDAMRGIGAPIDYSTLIKGFIFSGQDLNSSWIYRESLADSATGRDVASCRLFHNEHRSLVCISWLSYKNVIYELWFDGSQIARLPEFEKRVNALLAAWDVTDGPKQRQNSR